MSESNVERLERIKEIQNNAMFIHETGDPRMSLHDEVMKFWEQEHTDWLIEQAERFEILSEQHDGALAENRRLREALEFYADAKNWSVEIIKDNGNKHRITHVVNGDSGNIASKALEGTE